jgi:hypothetical protein
MSARPLPSTPSTQFTAPREAASDLEDLMLVHADLPQLDRPALWCELGRALAAVRRLPRSSSDWAWFAARCDAVSRALRRPRRVTS